MDGVFFQLITKFVEYLAYKASILPVRHKIRIISRLYTRRTKKRKSFVTVGVS